MDTIANSIILVCAADDLYAMPLSVTIRSVLENLSKDRTLCLFILDQNTQPSQKDRILQSIDFENIQVEWIKVASPTLAKIHISNPSSYPLSSYFRLLIPYLLPADIKKVIYLDTDVIVKGDLSNLWDIDIQNYYALAVQDVAVGCFSKVSHIDCQKLGVSPDQKYFNSGVMVINLEQWRIHNIPEKALSYLEHYPLRFPDQDALNIVLAQHWRELDPHWNQGHAIHLLSSWKESPYEESAFLKALNEPYIVHFSSQPKPWMFGCTHPEKDLFFHYLSLTDWAEWKLTPFNYLLSLQKRALRKIKRLSQKITRLSF
jgi:lipopolysaccharide biosynthesis glycosyltransferase